MPKRVAYLFALVLFLSFHPPVLADTNIVINEFLAKPSTQNSEWVEFYNPTSQTIDLSDYYFDDDTSFESDSGSSAIIALSGLLQSQQTCYWELPNYLNNNGDSPSLFKTGETSPIDTFTYTEAQADASFSRVPDGSTWQSNQTPTKSSNKCLDLAPSPTPSPTPSPASSTPQSTSTKSPTPTPKPSATPAKSSSPSPSASNSVLGSKTEEQLSLTSTPEASPAQSAEGEESKGSSKTKIAAMLTGSGVILIGLSIGFFVLYNKTLNKEASKEEGKDIN